MRFGKNAKTIIALLFSIATQSNAWGQSNIIRISSPTESTLTTAGSTFNVVVESPAVIKNMFLLSRGPFVVEPLKRSAPFEFRVNTSANAAPGDYALTAVADLNGNPVFSGSLHVFVDAPLEVQSMVSDPKQVLLPFPGSKVLVTLAGQLSTGATSYLPQSQVVFASNDQSVISVDPAGYLLATNSGETTVVAHFRNLSLTIPARVLDPIRGDFNGDGTVDIDDVNFLQSYLNTKAATPNDAKDLNGDGKIDALDLRILTTLCNKPRCAK